MVVRSSAMLATLLSMALICSAARAAEPASAKHSYDLSANIGLPESLRHLPKGHELIIETTSVCGFGYLYSVVAGRYSKQQMEWLRRIYRFRFADAWDAYPVSFSYQVAQPLTASEMQTLLNDRSFVEWVGPKMVAAIRKLGAARKVLMVWGPSCRPLRTSSRFPKSGASSTRMMQSPRSSKASSRSRRRRTVPTATEEQGLGQVSVQQQTV
jgi:hypothetical protein